MRSMRVILCSVLLLAVHPAALAISDEANPDASTHQPPSCWSASYRFASYHKCRRTILNGHVIVEISSERTDTGVVRHYLQYIHRDPRYPERWASAQYSFDQYVGGIGSGESAAWMFQLLPVRREVTDFGEICIAEEAYMEGECETVFAAAVRSSARIGWTDLAVGGELDPGLDPMRFLEGACWRPADASDELGVRCFERVLNGQAIRGSEVSIGAHPRLLSETLHEVDGTALFLEELPEDMSAARASLEQLRDSNLEAGWTTIRMHSYLTDGSTRAAFIVSPEQRNLTPTSAYHRDGIPARPAMVSMEPTDHGFREIAVERAMDGSIIRTRDVEYIRLSEAEAEPYWRATR